MTDTLRIASAGPEVGNWQRFLVGMNVHDFEGVPISVDEVFGRRTAHGTRVYQAFRKIPETGFVDPLTRKAAIAEGFVPFIPAKNQTLLWPNTSRDINVIVVYHASPRGDDDRRERGGMVRWQERAVPGAEGERSLLRGLGLDRAVRSGERCRLGCSWCEPERTPRRAGGFREPDPRTVGGQVLRVDASTCGVARGEDVSRVPHPRREAVDG